MDIFKAVLSLQPNAKFSLTGNDYENLVWFDGNVLPPPTEEEVLEEAERLQQEYEAKEYQRQRAPEYPPIGDQLDALFHAGVFPPEMAEKIQAIKDKYPKPQ